MKHTFTRLFVLIIYLAIFSCNIKRPLLKNIDKNADYLILYTDEFNNIKYIDNDTIIYKHKKELRTNHPYDIPNFNIFIAKNNILLTLKDYRKKEEIDFGELETYLLPADTLSIITTNAKTAIRLSDSLKLKGIPNFIDGPDLDTKYKGLIYLEIEDKSFPQIYDEKTISSAIKKSYPNNYKNFHLGAYSVTRAGQFARYFIAADEFFFNTTDTTALRKIGGVTNYSFSTIHPYKFSVIGIKKRLINYP